MFAKQISQNSIVKEENTLAWEQYKNFDSFIKKLQSCLLIIQQEENEIQRISKKIIKIHQHFDDSRVIYNSNKIFNTDNYLQEIEIKNNLEMNNDFPSITDNNVINSISDCDLILGDDDNSNDNQGFYDILQNFRKLQNDITTVKQTTFNVNNDTNVSILNSSSNFVQNSIILCRLNEINELKSQYASIKQRIIQLQDNCKKIRLNNLFENKDISNDILLENETCKKLCSVANNTIRKINEIEENFKNIETLIATGKPVSADFSDDVECIDTKDETEK